jgi:hypothetical protein
MSAAELWPIDETAFPREGDAAARFAFAARCAVLAPSRHNKPIKVPNFRPRPRRAGRCPTSFA